VDKSFLLEVVTPTGLAVSSNVEEAVMPGSQGEFGVLPGHTPFLTSLRIGMMHYRRGKDVFYMALNRGFAEVSPVKATILADKAEAAEDIDLERVRAAQKNAEERLKTLAKNDPGYAQEVEALEWANVRIKVAEKAVR
jgi:F-type H+-transporting ATPase subunit epsilon